MNWKWLIVAPVSSSDALAVIVLAVTFLLGHPSGAEEGASVQFPATPFISPAPGTYTKGLTVTITDATAGTTIYYTTDGSAPTVASQQYSGPISISTVLQTKTIRAFAVKAGVYGSPATATYNIVPLMAPPSFSIAQGYYMGPQSVSLTGPQTGTVIRYTVDGSTPTANSSVYSGTPIRVVQRTTIKAFVAAKGGYGASPVVAQTYSIIPTTPFISPAPGTYTAGLAIKITDGTPGTVIYFTTDGSAPTTASPRYTAPISIPAEPLQETVRAFATLNGVYSSATSSTFTIRPPVPAPAPLISPMTGSYTTNMQITISDSLPEAKLYYTLDGSAPTSGAIEYTGPFSLPPRHTGIRIVRAIALSPGYLPSPISQSTMTITLPAGVVATATANDGAPVTTIPTDFLGFSHEWGAAQAMMGDSSTAVNQIYRKLVSTLSTTMGGNLNIRVGGSSTDLLSPATTGTVTPFSELAQASNVNFILGVNLGSNSLSLAKQQAQIFTAALPGSTLSAIEIGNEPDGYSMNGFRPSTYTFNDFLLDYQDWTLGISSLSKSAIPFAGPSLGGGGWMASAQASVENSSLQAAIFTQHKYVACYYDGNPLPANILLQPTSSTTSMLFGLQTYVSVAHQAHARFRVDELNSICNGGQRGVSDTFSASLWAIDTMFELANIKVDGVNWNTSSNNGPYDLFRFSSPAGGKYFLLGVRPLYYGLLLFARSAGNNAQLLPVDTLTNSNIKIWATRDRLGHGHILIINKELSVAGNVEVTMPGYNKGTTNRLTAGNYLSTNAITVAGQTYDGSTDGALQGSVQTETIYPVEGTWTIPVGAVSAVLVDLQP